MFRPESVMLLLMSCFPSGEVVTGGVGWMATRGGDEGGDSGARIGCTSTDDANYGPDFFHVIQFSNILTLFLRFVGSWL